MWKSLGFKESPYDARPLRPVPKDADLLVGRSDEEIEFGTLLESADSGVILLSGPPGVGKTSFFNVQQYRLASKTAEYGPHLLCTETLCTVNPGDTAIVIARRVLESLIRSVETECSQTGKKAPPETAKIAKWFRAGGGKGISIGITILGSGGSFGRNVELPSANDISYEGLTDAITAIALEVIEHLGFEGSFVTLDNVENLDDEELAALLMTFRDTLFSIPKLWWVIIGQAGLASLLQTLDNRVSDRIAGSIELSPISYEEFEDAIARRVEQFSDKATKSPLPKAVHKQLYDASISEIRFVLRMCNDLCTAYVSDMRKQAKKLLPEFTEFSDTEVEAVADRVSAQLINNQIPEDRANSLLRAKIQNELNGLSLRDKEAKVLSTIYEKGEARAKEFREFPVTSMQDLSSNYLSRFHKMHLLSRRQEGRAVFYRLRGTVLLAAEMGLLKSEN